MRRLFVPIAVALAAGIMIAGCSQAAPAPTQAPAKPAEPTKAAAPAATSAPAAPAAPTAAPAAKKVDFPQKGKTLQMIIPFGPGGGSDITGRLIQPGLEKELGATVEAVNKAGGGAQVGLQELFRAKPDGYTFGMTNMPQSIAIYLDPERKSTYTRKDIQPIANAVDDTCAIIVAKDSKYKSFKDFVDAAKANPNKITATGSGTLNPSHLSVLQLNKVANVKVKFVVFDQAGEERAALMGGHMDSSFGPISEMLDSIKNGDVIPLATFDAKRSPFLPNVPTAGELGYKVEMASVRGFSGPVGIPPEIVQILSDAVGKTLQMDDTKKRLNDTATIAHYMNTADYTKWWDSFEQDVKVYLQMAADDAKQK